MRGAKGKMKRETERPDKVIRGKTIKMEESVKEKDRKLVCSPYQLKEEIPLIRRLEDQIMCWLAESKPVRMCESVINCECVIELQPQKPLLIRLSCVITDGWGGEGREKAGNGGEEEVIGGWRMETRDKTDMSQSSESATLHI